MTAALGLAVAYAIVGGWAHKRNRPVVMWAALIGCGVYTFYAFGGME